MESAISVLSSHYGQGKYNHYECIGNVCPLLDPLNPVLSGVAEPVPLGQAGHGNE